MCRRRSLQDPHAVLFLTDGEWIKMDLTILTGSGTGRGFGPFPSPSPHEDREIRWDSILRIRIARRCDHAGVGVADRAEL